MAPKIPRTVVDPRPPVTGGMHDVFGKSSDFPTLSEIDVADILDNPHQPRRHFDEEAIRSLADSIAAHGLAQPILVRRHPDLERKYLLVAGERRLHAHRLLERKTIFAIVSEREDAEVLTLIENVQRQDLNAIELARGLSSLAARGDTLETVGKVAGLTASAVSRIIAVLRLPAAILEAYPECAETVSRSTLMELVDVKDEKTQLALWQRAKLGLLSRDELRETVRRERKTTELGTTSGHDLKKLARTLKALKTNVLALDVYRNHLAVEHKAILRDLQAHITALLGDDL